MLEINLANTEVDAHSHLLDGTQGPQEMDSLPAAEEEYIFPFEQLQKRLAEDGFCRDTLHAIQRDSRGKVTCKVIIRIIQDTKEPVYLAKG